jgi:parvulin-like peptidyl-prolyl isomerase
MRDRGHVLFTLCFTLSCGGAASSAGSEAKAPDSQGKRGAGATACVDQANASFEKRTGEPGKVRVRHILVRHIDSKNAAGATRNRQEACARAAEARGKLEAGEEWNDVATAYSDEKGVAELHGDLGLVARDALDPAFADAAFSLGVDETSHVVESKSGFHVIQRTE